MPGKPRSQAARRGGRTVRGARARKNMAGRGEEESPALPSLSSWTASAAPAPASAPAPAPAAPRSAASASAPAPAPATASAPVTASAPTTASAPATPAPLEQAAASPASPAGTASADQGFFSFVGSALGGSGEQSAPKEREVSGEPGGSAKSSVAESLSAAAANLSALLGVKPEDIAATEPAGEPPAVSAGVIVAAREYKPDDVVAQLVFFYPLVFQGISVMPDSKRLRGGRFLIYPQGSGASNCRVASDYTFAPIPGNEDYSVRTHVISVRANRVIRAGERLSVDRELTVRVVDGDPDRVLMSYVVVGEAASAHVGVLASAPADYDSDAGAFGEGYGGYDSDGGASFS